MIHDVSETLAAILSFKAPARKDVKLATFIEALKGRFPYLKDAVIQFDCPVEGTYKPAPPRALNLFLYDVRENLELRSNQPLVTRHNNEVFTQRPAMRVACSYLITAWLSSVATDDQLPPPLREQRLLGEALQVLAQYPTIPEPLLQGSLAGQEALPLVVAQGEGLKDQSEFWTAIKGKLRPSLIVTVTVSMPMAAEEKPELVTTRVIRTGERTGPDEKQISPAKLQTKKVKGPLRIVGRVTDNLGAPIKEAVVMIPALGLRAGTDADGQYRLEEVPEGTHILLVQPGWTRSNFDEQKVDGVTVSASAETVRDVRLLKTSFTRKGG